METRYLCYQQIDSKWQLQFIDMINNTTCYLYLYNERSLKSSLGGDLKKTFCCSTTTSYRAWLNLLSIWEKSKGPAHVHEHGSLYAFTCINIYICSLYLYLHQCINHTNTKANQETQIMTSKIHSPPTLLDTPVQLLINANI